MKKAEVKIHDRTAGWLTQDESGYHYVYDAAYLESGNAEPISKTLPLRNEEFHYNVLFPFFDGLIPEGWLLENVVKYWKLDKRDRMGLLLACCKDCVGAVSIHHVEGTDEQ